MAAMMITISIRNEKAPNQHQAKSKPLEAPADIHPRAVPRSRSALI
jgi:hypothetical protein